MVIALNGTATMFCNLLTDIRIAKGTGYEGIEIIGSKLYRYLDQGFTVKDLLPHLEGLPAVALGYVQDIERQEPRQYAALLEECEKMCALAEALGCPLVQLLTGPIDPSGPYKGLSGLSWPELRRATAKNLVALADIGAKHTLGFYLEPLNWAPLSTLDQALELIDAAERDNIGLLIDFLHMWCSGATPEQIAKLDKRLIAGVHFCDALECPGKRGGPAQPGRAVWTGGGNIPLKEWVDAVRMSRPCETGLKGFHLTSRSPSQEDSTLSLLAPIPVEHMPNCASCRCPRCQPARPAPRSRRRLTCALCLHFLRGRSLGSSLRLRYPYRREGQQQKRDQGVALEIKSHAISPFTGFR